MSKIDKVIYVIHLGGAGTNILFIGLCDWSLKATIPDQWFSAGTISPPPWAIWQGLEAFLAVDIGEGV